MEENKLSPGIAAKVMFLSDRTCCVCRNQGKPVQIHHIDGNKDNNIFGNLCVLCLDCHNETQVKGGFNRKLDKEQVILFRDDWYSVVARNRASTSLKALPKHDISVRIATTVSEILRENKQFSLLAMHYDACGNKELRDKYIEEALAQDPSDDSVVFLRSMQSHPERIPSAVLENVINQQTKTKDWSQLARTYLGVGNFKEATKNYCQSIIEDLDKGNLFSAAYYLQEMATSECGERLFEESYREFEKNGNLWWQVRALQELGWNKELKDKLTANKKTIEESTDIFLKRELYKALGMDDEYINSLKIFYRGTGTSDNHVETGADKEN